ncbi:MAG TPA: hypothetical protein VF292_06580 [Rhodanobacteraceae bacterium]
MWWVVPMASLLLALIGTVLVFGNIVAGAEKPIVDAGCDDAPAALEKYRRARRRILAGLALTIIGSLLLLVGDRFWV